MSALGCDLISMAEAAIRKGNYFKIGVSFLYSF
jgi:hypothetical protein